MQHLLGPFDESALHRRRGVARIFAQERRRAFHQLPTCGSWIDRWFQRHHGAGPIGWEQPGFRTLKCLFVINNSEGVPKMKTAAIAPPLRSDWASRVPMLKMPMTDPV